MDFTLLKEEDVFSKVYTSSSNRLSIFKDFSPKAEVTDYSILLGCSYDSKDDKNYGWYYLRTPANMKDRVRSVDMMDNFRSQQLDIRSIGARPAIKYSNIKLLSKIVEGHENCIEIEYGEYPQTVVTDEFALELEFAYEDNKLNKTGKVYTTDKTRCDDYEDEFEPLSYNEFEYKGNKYIRFIVGYNGSGEEIKKGLSFDEEEICYIKVEPVRWLVDVNEDVAVSKKILFSGIKFSDNEIYTGDFENTNIKRYLDTYFSDEIIPSKLHKKEEKINYNPYGFDFSEVSEEEIIRGAVESNIAVFLHGRSSEGKSARVKQIDPDCEIIYLRNATPDSLNGKSVFNSETNEMIDIPPTWYKKVVEKCNAEPDKIHIIFFDEITNALPSIQGMAFNIVLDGEVNGIWKLPENARIIAAGNDLEDSKAAQEMAEPLFNRFAHVYINTTVEDWLKWASTPSEEYERLEYKQEEIPMKIHPSIYAYIAYKSYSKQDVLRTPYNGKTPNADPRKWELSSKVLYKTRKPEMLRALIGEELTRDFVVFCSKQVITLEDVINGNYTESDLEMNTSKKYSTAVGLSSVDEEHIEVLRDFVKRLGSEICSVFDTLWIHGDESRLEKIAELKMSEKAKK